MPELPEVETIVRELRRDLPGRVLKKICVYGSNAVCRTGGPIDRDVLFQKIARVDRRGKYILLQMENKTACLIHLGMTGKLVLHSLRGEEKYLRVRFELSKSRRLYYYDIRKFGRIRFCRNSEELNIKLGPEPLQREEVFSVLKQVSSRRPIKSILLDQSVLAGIGNIYADESLYRAGIHPLTPARFLTLQELKALSRVIPEVLQEAIDRQGTTLRDYRTTSNLPGSQQGYLRVYGREKHACLHCETGIQRVKIGGRSSFFCPRCQPEKACVSSPFQ